MGCVSWFGTKSWPLGFPHIFRHRNLADNCYELGPTWLKSANVRCTKNYKDAIHATTCHNSSKIKRPQCGAFLAVTTQRWVGVQLQCDCSMAFQLETAANDTPTCQLCRCYIPGIIKQVNGMAKFEGQDSLGIQCLFLLPSSQCDLLSAASG